MVYKALTIAGFDGSGGAGLQADLKTFSALGCYGMTVLTALPVQNTCGVRNCYEIPLSAIEEQLLCIFEDITPDAIKIGMLFDSAIIKLVSNFLKQHAAGIPIVLDPVAVAKSGHALLLPEAVDTLSQLLMPLATVVTPNLSEAQTFTGMMATQQSQMMDVALHMLRFGSRYVLLKGGHLDSDESNDLLLGQDGSLSWFNRSRVDTNNTHGTGCTLSAAIAAYLAMGKEVHSACSEAKNYLHQALIQGKDLQIGHGHGPVHHFHAHWKDA